MGRSLVLTVLLFIACAGSVLAQDYEKAARLERQGNYKEAFEEIEKVLAKPGESKMLVRAFSSGLNCLRRLNRINDYDAYREKVVNAHATDWLVLQTVARSYMNDQYHYGFMVAGKFERGNKRGGNAKAVTCYERDRVRALQLMEQALPFVTEKAKRGEKSSFYLEYARWFVANRGNNEPWRLQYKTDLTKLPDYKEGHNYRWYYYDRSRSYAPVDEKGDPIFHKTPKTFETAATDGERWRFLLAMAMEHGDRNSAMAQYAEFLWQQFGVQTMSGYAFGRNAVKETERTGSILTLHTLKENETVARLATGIKRFTLPTDYDFMRIFKSLNNWNRLGTIYENRMQYPKAVACWEKINSKWARDKIDQIVGNYGTFEPDKPKLAGEGAKLHFRFRNGKKVNFSAWKIDMDLMIKDVIKVLKSNPKKIDYNMVNFRNIGSRLIQANQKKYIGEMIASWSLDLKPRKAHFDSRIEVATPLQKAGVYLVEGQMENGNVSRIAVWLNDTVIARKPLSGEEWYYVADAATGLPVAGAKVYMLGYRTEYVGDMNIRRLTGRRHNVITKELNTTTDDMGQFTITEEQMRDKKKHSMQWLTIVRKGDRLAFMGFEGIWPVRMYDPQYNRTRAFIITDRPVYRPGQTVKFKTWVAHSRYDVDTLTSFAGQSFKTEIHNPRHQKLFTQSYKADEYGGFEGEYTIPDGATLGVYQIYVPSSNGSLSFRVEEYKKPEFEVLIEAPDKPVMLGEKIPVKVKAKYYFGAPVTNATVKLKVLRSSYTAQWYPPAIWDWFYGPGYWWFAYDYDWYPGFGHWGCRAPTPWWWSGPREQPELVVQREMKIGEDGTATITLDSAIVKELHPDKDHRYEITAEVRDSSRRTIVGSGKVLVARKPFKVNVWLDRGHYRTGDPIEASFKAYTLDQKPVQGQGVLRLFKVKYDSKGKPIETQMRKWEIDTDAEGLASIKIQASEAGQFRLSYKVTDAAKHEIEGGYVFVIGSGKFDGSDFRFSKIELVPDKRQYSPGQKVKMMVNTDRRGAPVLLFLRPSNAYLKPKFLNITGKSMTIEIPVTRKDMPNFFVEALTIYDGQVHTTLREIVVPPEKRILNVKVESTGKKFKPGETTKVKVKVTDVTGEPFEGSLAMTMYDKAVEYISGGSNVPEIREFFWKWRRRHNARTMHNLSVYLNNVLKRGEKSMRHIGQFGSYASNAVREGKGDMLGFSGGRSRGRAVMYRGAPPPAAEMAMVADSAAPMKSARMAKKKVSGMVAHTAAPGGDQQAASAPQVHVRTKFADTAFWKGNIVTDKRGEAEVEVKLPENLTTWKIKTWAMGKGTRVGQGEEEIITTKKLLLRMQAPRFFVEKDEVILSANVHNYLEAKKYVKVVLETTPELELAKGLAAGEIVVEPNGEKRVDWRMKVLKEGTVTIRMKALTDEESDAMEMKFPVKVHGILKTESFSGHLRPKDQTSKLVFNVPKERRPAQSNIELRYSPTLAAAMVDALPYLAEYPYGCTEQTLSRFLPAAITQKVLINMGVKLADIKNKRTNLNAQEIGNDVERAKQWKKDKKWTHDIHGKLVKFNPVWDEAELRSMVTAGVMRLTNMQNSDGGWGWFSGYHERSYAHTTAYVVHGLQIAKDNDILVPNDVLYKGIQWLKRYQYEQVGLLKNAANKKDHERWKEHADNLDAFTFMVLTDARAKNKDMLEFIYRDRNHIAVYGKAMFGIALYKLQQKDKLAMIRRNLDQYVVQDDENQTAYLKLPNTGYWWYWYGSEYEAHAYYLKLLAKTDPTSPIAPRLVKYLLNNRKHATYWKSTRDTAICIEAFADFIRATKEDKPDMELELWLDGKKLKTVKINKDNLFSFDNKLVLNGKDVTSGKHTLELKRKGQGPIYYNCYVTYFSLEDYIKKAGLEVKVNRNYFKLVPVDKKIKAAGSRGQVYDKKVEKYKREPLKDLAELKSSDLVEVELVIDSKNDYEYIIFEDYKAAGFEPYAVRSGYNSNSMGAYMELRDDRVCFFVRQLARGRHSISYKLRAEIPGRFSALPTKAYAMYAPEIRANSDEIKLNITDDTLSFLEVEKLPRPEVKPAAPAPKPAAPVKK